MATPTNPNNNTIFYAVIIPLNCELPYGYDEVPKADELVLENIKDASAMLKRFKGSRMKTFSSKERALDFVNNPEKDESFMEDPSFSESLSEALEKLTISSKAGDVNVGTSESDSENAGDKYPTAKPGLLNQLRRHIEKGDYDKVEEMIWSNPKFLVTVCDSAVYLMAGPKYNACHIAARANKPDLMALILDTVSNISFMRKLYPKEADANVQDRVNHLLDSYLNTPDPRQGNTPLHFACKLGHYRVVRVLLTFEGCDLTLKDSAGRTAEESICLQVGDSTNNEEEDGGATEPESSSLKKKIKDMFKSQLHLPLHRDQLKKRLLLAKRRNQAGANFDSDISFSSDTSFSDSFTFISPNASLTMPTTSKSTQMPATSTPTKAPASQQQQQQ